MLEFIIPLIVFISFYILLIFTIINPEEMARLGTKWRYKGNVQPSKGYIRYTRMSAIISIMALTLILISCFINCR